MKYFFLYGSTVSTLVLGYSFWNVSQAINLNLPIGATGDRTTGAPPGAPHSKTDSIQSPAALLLDQARAHINANRFREAFALLEQVPVKTPERQMAQRYKEIWSRELLRRAVNKYTQSDIAMALKMLDAIPSNTSSYRQSIELTSLWKTEAKYAKVKDPARDFLFRPSKTRLNQQTGTQTGAKTNTRGTKTEPTGLFYPSTETISQVMSVPVSSGGDRASTHSNQSVSDRAPLPTAPRLLSQSPFSSSASSSRLSPSATSTPLRTPSSPNSSVSSLDSPRTGASPARSATTPAPSTTVVETSPREPAAITTPSIADSISSPILPTISDVVPTLEPMPFLESRTEGSPAPLSSAPPTIETSDESTNLSISPLTPAPTPAVSDASIVVPTTTVSQ